jgi:RecJ-like exonuclease
VETGKVIEPKPYRCYHCDGTGKVTVIYKHPDCDLCKGKGRIGLFNFSTCYYCGGSGKSSNYNIEESYGIGENCVYCKGNGMIIESGKRLVERIDICTGERSYRLILSE